MRENGARVGDIAQKYNISKETVYRIINEYYPHLRRHEKRPWTRRELEAARAMKKEGMTASQIGEVINRTSNAVKMYLLRNKK